MLALLNALCEWRRSLAVTGGPLAGVSFYHVIDRTTRATPPALPSSRLSITLEPSDTLSGVPFTLTERVLVESLIDVDALSVYDIVAALRENLSGRSSYLHGAAILQHTLQPEEILVDPQGSGKMAALLTWTGRASWNRPAPRAAFSYADGQFTDESDGDPSAWAWDFGDGDTSTDQHPAHVYAAPGSYDVTLVARNRFGWTTARRTVTV